MGSKQKKRRNGKDIRNAFVMLCVTVAMMSTATYAWFTMTDSPTVEGLKLTAATTGGLEISKDQSTWAGSIDFESVDKELSPVSTRSKTGPAFHTPVYTGGTVTGVSSSAISDSELQNYVAKYTYYLRSTGSGSVNVGLKGGDGSTTGCYLKAESGDKHVEYSLRVGFYVNNTWFMYEPNANGDKSGVSALQSGDGANPVVPDAYCKQNTNGQFTSGGDKTATMLTLPSGEGGSKIDMYIWIEGTDKDCVNEIMEGTAIGQIQFTVVN